MEKKIVILGGGFGGIKAAFSLCKKLKRLNLEKKYELVLIDKNSYHTYTPLLYEAATTSKTTANQLKLKEIATYNLQDIFAGRKVAVINDLVIELDLIGGDVHLKKTGAIKFDYLILAAGSETNYFGIPGLKENSLSLKSFLDSLRIRDAIWEKAHENGGKKEIKILIGGAGATGVELAGEIKSWLCELKEELKNCSASVTLVEGAPTILPGFDERVVEKVSRRLKKIGVEIILNEFIEKAEPRRAILKSGRLIDFDIFIWTGGVKVASLIGALPLKKEIKGKVEVAGEMECLPQSPDLKLAGKIYGLGDAICFYNPETGRPIPLVAEAAIEQARVAAHNIIEDIKFSEGLTKTIRHRKYLPHEYPYIIPVGGKYAVAKFGPLVIWGFPGWVLKGLVELYYLLFNVLSPVQAVKIWLKGLWIFMKNDRLG